MLENTARAATIITNKPSSFVILRKEDFDTIKNNYVREEKEKRMLLNSSFPRIFDTNSITRLYKEKIYRLFID
jgi:hypothetical protein